jgi:hypothetical protein
MAAQLRILLACKIQHNGREPLRCEAEGTGVVEIREQHRREVMEKIGSEIVQKAEYRVSGLFTDQHLHKGPSQK